MALFLPPSHLASFSPLFPSPPPPSRSLSQCWCSQTSDYDAHGDGTCNIPCSGDGGETCGGDYSVSVYSNGGEGGGPAEPTDDSSYLGCFADDDGSRVFGVLKIEKSTGMTTEVNRVVMGVGAVFA